MEHQGSVCRPKSNWNGLSVVFRCLASVPTSFGNRLPTLLFGLFLWVRRDAGPSERLIRFFAAGKQTTFLPD